MATAAETALVENATALRDALVRLLSLNRTQGVTPEEYEQAEVDAEAVLARLEVTL